MVTYQNVLIIKLQCSFKSLNRILTKSGKQSKSAWIMGGLISGIKKMWKHFLWRSDPSTNADLDNTTDPISSLSFRKVFFATFDVFEK